MDTHDIDIDSNDNSTAGEDTTLAQLLQRTLSQSENYISLPPPSHAPPLLPLASTSSSSSAPSTSTYPHNSSSIASTSTSTSTSTATQLTPSLASLLSNLSLCASLISHLALFSPNESLSDLSTATLPCLLVPYYTGMLDMQSRTKDYKGRIEVLKRAKIQLELFRDRCDDYGLISRDRRKELSLLAEKGLPSDPMSRRDAKIRQYKEEKALKERLEKLEQRHNPQLRSIGSTSAKALDDDIDEGDDSLRSLHLTRISLCYMRAFNELTGIDGEIELLQNMPHNMSELPSSNKHSDSRSKQREEQDEQWRLDKKINNLTSPALPHQLIDSSGRILRPFTILPSSSTSSTASIDTRLRLQNQVFGPGHRLPNMSIDEYLDIERERGNILQGGGPKNTQEVNDERSAKKAFEEEEDTLEGDRRREEKRQKDLEWDEWKDSHKRGEGNRMNMG